MSSIEIMYIEVDGNDTLTLCINEDHKYILYGNAPSRYIGHFDTEDLFPMFFTRRSPWVVIAIYGPGMECLLSHEQITNAKALTTATLRRMFFMRLDQILGRYVAISQPRSHRHIV
jgi:hypothetical protein